MSEKTDPDPKTVEADGGPIIFVNQPEITDGWTGEEVADFREFLRRMRPIWEAIGRSLDDTDPAP